MTPTPDPLLKIVQKMACRFPDDIDAATDAALSEARKLPKFKEYVGDLVRDAVRHLIFDARHRNNVTLRKEAGGYGGPAKVKVGDSKPLGDMYAYVLGGKALGNILGKELPAVREKEKRCAAGHEANVRLCDLLIGIVPAEKAVRQVVKARQLMQLLREAQGGDPPLAVAGG